METFFTKVGEKEGWLPNPGFPGTRQALSRCNAQRECLTGQELARFAHD